MLQATAVLAETTRSPGNCMNRDNRWVSAIESTRFDLGGQVAGFLASGTWECTNIGGRGGCDGNLEMYHNDVHNTVDGDMATLTLASWDPLFWYGMPCSDLAVSGVWCLVPAPKMAVLLTPMDLKVHCCSLSCLSHCKHNLLYCSQAAPRQRGPVALHVPGGLCRNICWRNNCVPALSLRRSVRFKDIYMWLQLRPALAHRRRPRSRTRTWPGALGFCIHGPSSCQHCADRK